MKQIMFFAAITAISGVAAPSVAAQDRPDLALAAGSSAIAERGTAVMAAVSIPLGASRSARTVDRRVSFDLVAGPSLRLSDGQRLNPSNVINGDGVRLSFTPGHSTRLSLNGRSLVTRYATPQIAAAEGDESGTGLGTAGWLGIAGGVILVGLGVTYLAFEDAVDCTENGQYVCE